jgi:hypothetical protein
MRQYANYALKKLANTLEFVISLMLAVGIIILCAKMAGSILNIFDFDLWPNYEDLLSTCFNLIIGVELIRMMQYHTSSAVFEVLLFAIARQIITAHASTVGSLLGVICIAILFATRKFLFTKYDVAEPTIVRGTSKIRNINHLLHLNLPLTYGDTIAELIIAECERNEIDIAPAAIIELPNAGLRIAKIRDGIITLVEIIRSVQ